MMSAFTVRCILLLCTNTMIVSSVYGAASLTRNEFGTGFHRRIQTIVTLPQDTVTNKEPGCFICLKQVLPSGAHVDIFKVDQMSGPPLEVYADEKFLIGRPEFLSKNQEVLLFYNVSGIDAGKIKMEFPVEIRYHRAVPSKSATIQLGPPQVFLRCSNNPNKVKSLGKGTKLRCGAKTEAICDWIKLEADTADQKWQKPFSFTIPTGDPAETDLVSLLTLIISPATVIFLLNTMRRQKLDLQVPPAAFGNNANS